MSYYTTPITVTRQQAHDIIEKAGIEARRGHRKVDAMWAGASLEVAKLNGQWMLYTGTTIIAYLYNDTAQDAINSVCAQSKDDDI